MNRYWGLILILFACLFILVGCTGDDKDVEFTFGKMLPNQIPTFSKQEYEWVYEEVHGADFSRLIKAMDEGSF